jgi:hypothetical protein
MSRGAIKLDRAALREALGVLVEPLRLDHAKADFTLDAGAEATVHEVSGRAGYCTIFFSGDGDGTFRMRVYVDGELDDEFPTDEVRVGHYSFSSSLRVCIYNPAAAATHTSSGYTLRGLSRPE